MLQYLLLSCCCITISLTHNIDVKVGPIFKTHTASSYFGFSATGVVSDSDGSAWVAVGSPKANTSGLNQRDHSFDTNSTGALYKCQISMDPSDCTDITKDIQSFIDNFDPSDGWYGVSVVGGRKEDKYIIVCSHRPVVEHCGVIAGNCQPAMPGTCVVLTKDEVFEDDITEINRNNARDYQGHSVNFLMSYERSRFGETGIAAAVGVDKKCYASAVGDISYSGSIVDTEDNKYPASNQKYAYGGYSLATGTFFNAGSTEFAIGAPRHNVIGAVFLHESLSTVSSKPKVIILGEQYGSYFGMAICAGDFDGDQLFEVVVGAPYYAESLSVPSSGKVYVYSSKDNFASPVQSYSSPNPQAHALFGKAVATIGDMDLNGYNDLVIGAPYEGDGVLYIYHGSESGLSSEPVQSIKASEFANNLKTFGWSVRGETDLDGNGYPDIVVGAYASDSMMILRTVPVVEVDIEYKLSSPTIDVSNRNCTVKNPKENSQKTNIQTVCFNIEVDASYMDRAGKMTNEIELSFELDADTMVEDKTKRRVIFESTGSSHKTIKSIKVKQGTKIPIVIAKAYLRVDLCKDCEDAINPYPDIQFKVAAVLPDRPDPPSPPTSGDPPSLKPYFQLPYTEKDDVKNFTDTTIKVKRACDPCKPNLKIKNVGTTKIPVQSSDIQLEVEISNSADQAFLVKLMVDFPPPLRARHCGNDVECLYFGCIILNNASRMICDLGNIVKTAEKYKIGVDTNEASKSLGTYEVTINVTSANEEDASLLGDNSLVLKLNVASEADILMQADRKFSTASIYYGGNVRGQFAMKNENEIGLKVNHKYSVFNNGPDSVPEVNITIDWPYQAESGKHLLYLMNIQENDQVKCFPKPGWVNPLATQFKEGASRVRREADDDDDDVPAAPLQTSPARKGSSSTIVLDCANGTAMCISIPCTLSNIEKSKKVEIIMESRIWNGTLIEDYTDRDVIVISRARIQELTSYIDDMNQDNHAAEMSTTFFPASPKTTKKDLEVWIIVVSAIAGVVLLVILVVVFKMCGFFNRSGGARYDSVPEN